MASKVDSKKSTEVHQSVPSDNLVKDWGEYLKKAKVEFNEKMTGKLQTQDPNVKLDDFDFKFTLGTGGFGRVMLVVRKSNGKKYASKMQSKPYLVKSKQINQVYNEKKLLESLQFPFTLNLEFFFQDNVYLHFIMPLMESGDMFNLLRLKGKFDEHLARFYAAQVLLALEYLHYLDLIYRDIKPENILLDREGYLRVVDYGLCKKVKDRTYTFCGTPEYVAPEIILSQGYGKTADFWAFGILLYEFNSGTTPFYSDDPMKIYEKAVQGRYIPKAYFSSELKDIIKNLLQNDLTRRYGNLHRGIEDIKDHRWFRKIIWLAMFNKAIRPPYVPPSTGASQPSGSKEEPFEFAAEDPYKEMFAHF